jgi:hypothetical protein
MTQIAALLKPGGVFFLTTGNAEPHSEALLRWSYVHPDAHVSYFEPRTLSELYKRVGLEPLEAGFLPGHEDIIRYKVLKTLRLRSRNAVERLLPWRTVSRIVDRRHRVTPALALQTGISSSVTGAQNSEAARCGRRSVEVHESGWSRQSGCR